MKRMNKTTIALVTAGALGLGTMPFAQAQEARITEGVSTIAPSGDEATAGDIFGETPAPKESWVDPSIQPTPLPTGLKEQSGSEAVVGDKATEGSEWVTGHASANPAEATDIKQLSGTSEPAKANSFDRPKTTGTVTETLRPTTPAPAPAEGEKDKTRAIVLGTLGALVGLGLVIGGVKYFVNKDGDLVKDPKKVNQTASPAEKAESDKVKKDNAQEITKQLQANVGEKAAAQAPAAGKGAANSGASNAGADDDGTAATGERGMNASTGVTQLPAGLVALLVLSIIGAAGYAFTRRETV